VPVGVASLTDRLLPHLFPSTSENAFAATVDSALGIERPPPDRNANRATSLDALGLLATQNYFGPDSTRRLAIVLTDGESLPVDLGSLRARLLRERVVPLFVHVWGADERVFGPGGVPERNYRPDLGSRLLLEEVARAGGGGAFGENELAEVAEAAKRALGEGPTGPRGEELRSQSLAPHAIALAFAPLLFLLWRRNLS
jgi:hypothetical protein